MNKLKRNNVFHSFFYYFNDELFSKGFCFVSSTVLSPCCGQFEKLPITNVWGELYRDNHNHIIYYKVCLGIHVYNYLSHFGYDICL